jgi:DGQHR domain-containing protein
MASRSGMVLSRRALRIHQSSSVSLYVFTLTAKEILEIADISRVKRDEAGKLIGYQRPEVRSHVKEIVEYLNEAHALFPNPIILALSSAARFVCSRGPSGNDGLAQGGSIELRLPDTDQSKPAWIVDGQQRALALSQADNQDFPVPVTAFLTDSVDVQRDQFLRVNNTKPLPRGLVTELLPEVDMPLPPRLSIKQMPSEVCNLLNQNEKSPFYGLVRRASSNGNNARSAVVQDTSVIRMLEESLSSSGCLFIYRNMSSGETDSEGLWRALTLYWSAVKDTFPDAWGKPPSKSRLMHGAGIRAMGRLMDRVLTTLDPSSPEAPELVRSELAAVAPHCRWTSGTWKELGHKWNDIQNTPRHIQELSNYLIRTYMKSRAARA